MNEAEKVQAEAGKGNNGNLGPVVVTELGNLPETALLDVRALADIFGISPRTVARLVERYELPPPIRTGGRRMWFAGRVLAHLRQQAERVEKEAEVAARKIRQLTS